MRSAMEAFRKAIENIQLPTGSLERFPGEGSISYVNRHIVGSRVYPTLARLDESSVVFPLITYTIVGQEQSQTFRGPAIRSIDLVYSVKARILSNAIEIDSRMVKIFRRDNRFLSFSGPALDFDNDLNVHTLDRSLDIYP